MSYECPICRRGKVTITSSSMCTHMVGTSERTIAHQEWIESHGISYPSLVGISGKGNYSPLIAVIEKECKIND